MATAKSSKKPPATKRPTTTPPASPRVRSLRLPLVRAFHWQPRIKHPIVLPSVWRLTCTALTTLWRHRWLFLWVTVVYALLTIIFVRGLGGGMDVSSLKDQLDQLTTGAGAEVASSVSVFFLLLGSSDGGSSAAAGVYQIFLGLIVSLAIIWLLRKVVAGESVRLRDGFYQGMYPLVPFMLVLLVVSIQCLPLLIGGELYSLVVTGGIAVGAVERLLWGLLFVVSALVTLYLLCSSLFALYIVTLPNMTPMKALRSARQLVRFRRLQVARKLLFLPFMLLVVSAAIMVPLILFAAPLAQWVFFVLSMLGLTVVHAYMYSLYRELLEQ